MVFVVATAFVGLTSAFTFAFSRFGNLKCSVLFGFYFGGGGGILFGYGFLGFYLFNCLMSFLGGIVVVVSIIFSFVFFFCRVFVVVDVVFFFVCCLVLNVVSLDV